MKDKTSNNLYSLPRGRKVHAAILDSMRATISSWEENGTIESKSTLFIFKEDANLKKTMKGCLHFDTTQHLPINNPQLKVLQPASARKK